MIPVAIDGAYKSQPKGRWIPKPAKIRVLFGQPLDYSTIENNKKGWEFITQDLQNKIENLVQTLRKDDHV